MAAKAAGVTGTWASVHQAYGDVLVEGIDTGAPVYWNPLENDGDALRLAVKLWLVVDPGGNGWPTGAEVKTLNGITVFEPLGDDADAAVRRAIVRAAGLTDGE